MHLIAEFQKLIDLKQKLRELKLRKLKGELDKSTITARNFNKHLPRTDKTRI